MPTWATGWLADGNPYLLRFASLLFSLLASVLMASYAVLERRVAWQSCMMMLVASMAFNVQSDASAFFSMVLPVVVIGLLFRCDTLNDVVHTLYTLFLVATALALIFPQLLIMLPLLLLYPAFSGKLSAKALLAALLGFATPLWIVAALVYLFPSLSPLLDSPREAVASLWQIPHVALSPAKMVLLVAEFVVALPAMIHFFVTASIGRTHLRRRMIFCIVLNVVLWLAGWLRPELLVFFFVWRLPIYSLLSAYFFSVIPPKMSNVYFISSLLLWLVADIVGIWIG